MGSTWATLFLVLKDMVVKMFQQPPRGSEMVEGGGVDDAQDEALDCCMHESSQMVEGNGVHDDPVVALERCCCESSKSGENETGHRDLTRGIDIEDESKPHPDAESKPCESAHGTLNPIKESQVIDQQYPAESLDRPLSFEVSERGKKRARAAETSEEKPRKRGRNWTNPNDTDLLIDLRLQSLRNKVNVSRLDMNESSERVWEAISQHLPERTADECQNRWDTVVRSYKTIKAHLGNSKEFSQVSVEDFEKKRVGNYFRSAEWYKMFDEQREVWDRSHRGKGRRVANMNNGACTTAGTPALPRAEPVKPDASEVVKIAPALDRNEARLAACEVQVDQFTTMQFGDFQEEESLQSLLESFSPS